MAAVALAFILVSCSNAAQKADSNNSETDVIIIKDSMTTSKKTIQLTRADFLTKVANFEENPDQWVIWVTNRIIDFMRCCVPCQVLLPS